MIYANYSFYEQYGSGAIDEADFERLAHQASRSMDYVTFDRLPELSEIEITDKIRLCCVELIDYFHAVSKFIIEDRGVIVSEAVATWRTTYKIPDNLSPDNKQESIVNICQRWLVRPINYMYVGV